MVALFGGLQATSRSSDGPSTGANRAATRRFDPPWLGFRRDSEVDAPPIEVAIILALMVINQVEVVDSSSSSSSDNQCSRTRIARTRPHVQERHVRANLRMVW